MRKQFNFIVLIKRNLSVEDVKTLILIGSRKEKAKSMVVCEEFCS